MLWSIGVASSSAAHKLLTLSDPKHVPTEHPRYLAGTEIMEVLHLRKGGEEDLRARIQREYWDKSGPIISVANQEGDLLTFSVAPGGNLSLRIERGGASR